MPNGRERGPSPTSGRRDGVHYLTVTGLLHPDNRLELEPGFVTDQPEYSGEDLESELTVEFLDDAGAVLLRYGVAAGPVCADGSSVDYWIIAAKVPFPEGARAMRVLRRDVVLDELRVPEQGPAVRLEWEPDRERTGEQVIRWSGEHPEQVPLRYIISYSNDDGQTWRPVAPPTPDAELVVDFDRLPGGERCLLGLTATDGFNTVTTTTEAFDVPRKPCLAMVLAPEDGTVFGVGEIVTLQGQGFYLEENQPELEALEWSSSRDGPLGRGALLRLDRLSPGVHALTLLAGREGRVGQSTSEIVIGGD